MSTHLELEALTTGQENPYVALFMDAVRAAKEQRASDLHIEPTRSGVVIRMRVFGDMQPPWRGIEAAHRLPLIKAVKQVSGLEIGVSGRPQDGRWSVPSLGLDLRVNLLPTLFGEKVVLRLLDQTRRFGLGQISLTVTTKTAIEHALQSPDGVVLISGPTGSGKTSTLYAMLTALKPDTCNIVTLEDPVEYTLEGVNQVQISGKLSFADGLRAVLRQDPDVILVGEIRDRETAHLAFEAASTGHLVLSTVHANGAAEVITRLLGLGVEPYLIESNLRFSAAQRLVKGLCRNCAEAAPDEMRHAFQKCLGERMQPSPQVKLMVRGRGCPSCTAGLNGQMPLVEFLMEDEIKDGLQRRSLKPARSLAELAVGQAIIGAVDIREVIGFA